MQRLSVNINDETAAALNDLARRRQTTVTEAVRRAVSVYKYLEDQVQSGKELQLVDADHVVTLRLV